MVMSMTGFARVSLETEWGQVAWEVKSVNHRFLEAGFRLPEAFRLFEARWKKVLHKSLHRGKVECSLRFTPKQDGSSELNMDRELLRQLAEAGEQVQSAFMNQSATLDIMKVLAWPGLVQADVVDHEALLLAMDEALAQAVEKLQQMRQAEGLHLSGFMQERIDQMQQLVVKIDQKMPLLLEAMQVKLQTRFAEFKVECDKDRFEQEVVCLTHKADVAEELHRLQAHLQEVAAVLGKSGAIGRRLDFLMQELNREANTLASKSIDLAVTNASVDLKVLIEQMREQVQNIE